MKKQQQQLIIKAIYQNQKIYMTLIRQKCLHWIVFLAVENPKAKQKDTSSTKVMPVPRRK